ncbi:hypothetical protein [Austwickia chelonae]|uniref:hypothetical protein n=1 Tax=Austwickia chelonae TaxID=100225 RepID=UPI0012DE68A3|nr:hypothetical protein [Austwickia chelonae]
MNLFGFLPTVLLAGTATTGTDGRGFISNILAMSTLSVAILAQIMVHRNMGRREM